MRRISSTVRVLAVLSLTAGALLVAAPRAPATAAAPGAAMRVIDLGALPGATTSEAWAVNERGDVVGESGGNAVLWRDGRVIDLGRPAGVSLATDINDRGEIVGMSLDGYSTHAILWRDGRATVLPPLPGHTSSAAMAINNRGDVVGSSSGYGVLPHAVRWRNGRVVDLNPAAASGSYATEINSRGDVVGGILPPGEMMSSVPARWGRDGATILSAESGQASGVNDRGDVVGVFFDTGQSFFWRAGVLTRIDRPAGSTALQMEAINDRAQAVGHSNSDALRWEDGTTTVLPGLTGGRGAAAYDINDRGQIAGQAATSPSGGDAHAVLWVPVPKS